ncbi:MAG: DNA circularization N-terminal domain-containing protein [Pseudomonadota bacterium]
MRPVLDGLLLPQVQTLRTSDVRALAEHRAPEADGSYFQNLGRKATVIRLAGVASGPDALAFVTELTDKFEAGEAVEFVSDIATDAEIERVKITDLKTREVAGTPERLAYAMVLYEYREPEPPAAAGLDALDADVLGDATGLIEDLVEGLDLFPVFETGLERFAAPLGSLLERLQAVNRGS